MIINIEGLQTDISIEQARNAYHGTSFSPERRGDSEISSYVASMEKLAVFIEDNAKDDKQQAVKQDVFDTLRERYLKKTIAHLSARSRCMSTMITGPANFPTARNDKANNVERKRGDEWLDFHKNLHSYALKNLNKVYTVQEKQTTEIERLRNSLKSHEEAQERMKTANKLIRAKKLDELKELMPKHYEALMIPNCFGTVGFETFELTNNNNKIKRMKARLVELEAKSDAAEEHGELSQQLNGLTIVRNFEADRLQLVFDDKPGEDVRTLLKSHGFRWSPRYTAWQRKLTKNAINATRYHVLTKEVMKGYAV